MATSRRYPIGCTLGLILGGLACQALAEPPAAAPSNNGLMTFPNVRVLHAPPATTEQKPAADASSMRAYVDPVTGDLSAGTAEQARQLSNAIAARARTGVLTNSGATTASIESTEELIYGPNGEPGLMLTDQDAVFQKVHLDADGNLIQQCITGEDEAAHALHSHAAKDQPQQENHHGR
jgi:hypothetical protein